MFDDVIQPGMTFTIEPMLTLGTNEWDMWDDGWTVVTKDGRRTAQFEHTLLVTRDRRGDPDPPLTAIGLVQQRAAPIRAKTSRARRARPPTLAQVTPAARSTEEGLPLGRGVAVELPALRGPQEQIGGRRVVARGFSEQRFGRGRVVVDDRDLACGTTHHPLHDVGPATWDQHRGQLEQVVGQERVDVRRQCVSEVSDDAGLLRSVGSGPRAVVLQPKHVDDEPGVVGLTDLRLDLVEQLFCFVEAAQLGRGGLQREYERTAGLRTARPRERLGALVKERQGLLEAPENAEGDRLVHAQQPVRLHQPPPFARELDRPVVVGEASAAEARACRIAEEL